MNVTFLGTQKTQGVKAPATKPSSLSSSSDPRGGRKELTSASGPLTSTCAHMHTRTHKHTCTRTHTQFFKSSFYLFRKQQLAKYLKESCASWFWGFFFVCLFVFPFLMALLTSKHFFSYSKSTSRSIF